jgi:protein TonB
MTGAAILAALTISYAVRLADSGIATAPPTFVAEIAAPPAPAETPRRPPAKRETEEAVPAPPAPSTPTEAAPSSDGEVLSTQPISISEPHWLQRPRGLDRYYPTRAREAGVEGSVLLDCAVTTIGALQCAVVSETPANWGFGAAARRMSEAYRMAPATRDGQPVEGRYRMRIPFTLRAPV